MGNFKFKENTNSENTGKSYCEQIIEVMKHRCISYLLSYNKSPQSDGCL